MIVGNGENDMKQCVICDSEEVMLCEEVNDYFCTEHIKLIEWAFEHPEVQAGNISPIQLLSNMVDYVIGRHDDTVHIQ